MKDMGIVHGSAGMAKPVVIGYDTVYVHTDIVELPQKEGRPPYYQYHEVQYTYQEYSLLMANKVKDLEQQNKKLERQQLDLMAAVSDLCLMQLGGGAK